MTKTPSHTPCGAQPLLPRSTAREVAFQVLYQDEVNPPEDSAAPSHAVEFQLLVDLVRKFRQELEEDDPSDTQVVAAETEVLDRWLASPKLIEFTRSLVEGVREHREDLDRRLDELALHWSLDRMASTDRVILRVGAYEIIHTETPKAVAVDEAIELAKRFGSARSAAFVNGILDRFLPEEKHGLL